MLTSLGPPQNNSVYLLGLATELIQFAPSDRKLKRGDIGRAFVS